MLKRFPDYGKWILGTMHKIRQPRFLLARFFRTRRAKRVPWRDLPQAALGL